MNWRWWKGQRYVWENMFRKSVFGFMSDHLFIYRAPYSYRLFHQQRFSTVVFLCCDEIQKDLMEMLLLSEIRNERLYESSWVTLQTIASNRSSNWNPSEFVILSIVWSICASIRGLYRSWQSKKLFVCKKRTLNY